LNLDDVGTIGPVEVTSQIGANTMLTCTFGADIDGANPEWHLTLEDTALEPTTRTVIAVMSAISATTPTARSHQRNNQLGGGATDCYLLDILATSVAL
jgi:hypothetical protein